LTREHTYEPEEQAVSTFHIKIFAVGVDRQLLQSQAVRIRRKITTQQHQAMNCSCTGNKSSAIAEMARVVLVNPDHGIVENPILDANNVDFYSTTTLWCPSLHQVTGRYGTQP